MAENAFQEKEDYLISAREEVVRRDAMAAELDKLRAYQKKLSKNISVENKSIEDEIDSTIRKRKQEISAAYDERLDDNRARKKKIAIKRDKKKSQRVEARIEEETKEITDENKSYDVEIKTLYKKNKVPGFCRRSHYFAMFMPRGLGEIVTMVLDFVLFFIVVPTLIVFIFRGVYLKDKDVNLAFWSLLIAAIVVVIQLILYFAIYTLTKTKHSDILLQGRIIRDKIKANQKRINAIKNSITKDRDDSVYNLDAYDKKLEGLDKELESISDEKKQALKKFENETKQLIINEINNRRIQSVNDMKAEKLDIDNKILKGEKKYSEKVISITNQYAQFIGEEFCKEDKLTDLINLMDEDDITTVSEAIAAYKGQKASK